MEEVLNKKIGECNQKGRYIIPFPISLQKRQTEDKREIQSSLLDSPNGDLVLRTKDELIKIQFQRLLTFELEMLLWHAGSGKLFLA